jgi:hypothetical protein
MTNKKGLNTKIITVFNPENDDDFELFVTYEILDSDLFDDEDTYYDIDGDIDLKSYEPNNDDEIPEWVNEDLVYEALLEEIDSEQDEGEVLDEDDDYYDDFSGIGSNEPEEDFYNDDDENY